MATLADLQARVEQYAYGATPKDRPFETTLAEALDSSETDVDVLDGDDWSRGDILEVQETGEQMYVLSVSTNTLTVQRSYGTVAASAAATGGLVRKNPRFTVDQINEAILDVVNSIGNWGVHGFSTGTLTLVASQYGYSVPETDVDDAYGVLACYYPDDTTEIPVQLPFRDAVQLSTSPSEWSSSYIITLLSKGDRAAGDTVYYTYAQSLAWDTDWSTTLAKLSVEQEELIVLGAASQLLGFSIIPATQDPGVRTDRTVQPGQTSRDGRWFQGEFFLKSRAEAARLAVLRQRLRSNSSVRTARARRWRP